jgi:hypothetical protein
MDVYHQSGTGKILLSSNDRYIILCREPMNKISPNDHNTNLIIRSNPDGIIKQNIEFFQNNNEYRKVVNSTKTFNYRNVTPLNEYYL